MLRSLRNRVAALTAGRESADVIDAIAMIEDTGDAPPGPAGDRSRALWQRATDLGITSSPERWLWCHLRATGQSIAEMSEEALRAPAP
jgi:hypothetical protein